MTRGSFVIWHLTLIIWSFGKPEPSRFARNVDGDERPEKTVTGRYNDK